MTKLSSSLPDGNTNGLGSISDDLITTPHRLHIVIAVIDCKSTTCDNDSGEVVPTARIRRIEPISNDDRELAAQIMRRAMESRTGKAVLPIELENDLRAALDGIDPDTGEILGDGGN